MGRAQTPPELAFLKEGWLTLGGEQRAAHFRVLAPADMAEEQRLLSREVSSNLLYFATPAYFKNGWLPEIPKVFPKAPIAAALNRYLAIGGWLLAPGTAGGASKVTRRCVPAGSVYYFENDTDVSALVKQPLTEYGWQIGYGLAYTGEY